MVCSIYFLLNFFPTWFCFREFIFHSHLHTVSHIYTFRMLRSKLKLLFILLTRFVAYQPNLSLVFCMVSLETYRIISITCFASLSLFLSVHIRSTLYLYSYCLLGAHSFFCQNLTPTLCLEYLKWISR